MTRLLIIDDDATLGGLLQCSLRVEGYDVEIAHNGERGLRTAFEVQPDLVVLDVMMPGMDGWETCERLREISDVPIIMLTAKTMLDDKLRGFEVGIDDYVTKPFSVRELIYRIQAVLSRTAPQQQEDPVRYEDRRLSIDLEARRVQRNGAPVHLTPTEFRLLRALVRRIGEVVPHALLLGEVWGRSPGVGRGTLGCYITYLRKKLEEDPQEPAYIRTDWGRGYYFAPGAEWGDS